MTCWCATLFIMLRSMLCCSGLCCALHCWRAGSKDQGEPHLLVRSAVTCCVCSVLYALPCHAPSGSAACVRLCYFYFALSGVLGSCVWAVACSVCAACDALPEL